MPRPKSTPPYCVHERPVTHGFWTHAPTYCARPRDDELDNPLMNPDRSPQCVQTESRYQGAFHAARAVAWFLVPPAPFPYSSAE